MIHPLNNACTHQATPSPTLPLPTYPLVEPPRFLFNAVLRRATVYPPTCQHIIHIRTHMLHWSGHASQRFAILHATVTIHDTQHEPLVFAGWHCPLKSIHYLYYSEDRLYSYLMMTFAHTGAVKFLLLYHSWIPRQTSCTSMCCATYCPTWYAHAHNMMTPHAGFPKDRGSVFFLLFAFTSHSSSLS